MAFINCVHGLRAVTAAQARAYNGVLTVGFTGTPGGAADAACTGHVQWPQVDDIEVLGVGAVNVSSVVVTVCPRPSHYGMAVFQADHVFLQ